jgi:Arylsulfotransferase (ASST)
VPGRRVRRRCVWRLGTSGTLAAASPLRVAVTLAAALPLAAALSGCGGASPRASVPAALLTRTSANVITVSPLAGTLDASPSTQISFLGVPGSQISHVSVVGSVSGAHAGHLAAYSTGTGASFLPDRPFTQGEHVTVRAHAGADTILTSFRIAHQATYSHKPFPRSPGSAAQVQHYLSAPDVTPSKVTVTTQPKAGAAPGDFFVAPYQGVGSPGPMILDSSGNLVWFHALPAGDFATDFRVQQFAGKPVLAWWQGHILSVGFGQGVEVLYDSAYHRVGEIRAGNGFHADLHELQITPAGTAWLDIFDPIDLNLTKVHGSANGVLSDSIVQEIDIKTGLVMFEWHALGHVALGDSHNPPPPGTYPWDYIHVNSISVEPSGNLLLSARNTWTLYEIDAHTGEILWRLGGDHSNYKLGPGVQFYWQHDAEVQPDGLISVFDNAASPPKEKQSRGLLLRVDAGSHTVSLVKQFVNPGKVLLASSQGNTQSLPGGDWLLGYGGLPNWTEFDSSGNVLFDASLAPGDQSYRDYLYPWTGQPSSPPSVAAQRGPTGAVTVEASWNGATQVASWQLLAGASASTLAPAATAPKKGFETAISLTTPAADVAVRALDASGKVLGTSASVAVH